MSELNEQWATVLAEAERRARASGRGDVVDYLNLRATNDFARTTAIKWLFDEFSMRAALSNRSGCSIQFAKADDHRFRFGSSTMVGTLLTFKSGVRSLMIEAGWPRVPQDGIVKGGGLAAGRIRHFGRKSLDHDLLLTRTASGEPRWMVLDEDGGRTPFRLELVNSHLMAFVRE